ncbi:MAG: hypothetical protein K8F92_03120 [Hyphomicrobium sp.]|uniref:hypothetical protein n=1 Tax=Hyphomicrobium sp. TaxID=82 RepID=UPI001320C4D5|nr:hypothetical protein [Hyphomicrobium sp.]KAB2940104.1 MAG: hypothetical protein F9K20_14740 [Hyphomicrobium sp.]MBZ0208632.1 hypothetical protein [Hyphomicrobium sp.]
MAALNYTRSSGLNALLLRSFAELVGDTELNRHLKRIRAALRSREVVSPASIARYSIPIGLSRFYGRRITEIRNLTLSKEPELYDAFAFVAGAVEFSRHMSPSARSILKGRVLSALKPAFDARPLAHEFRTAFCFAQQGWDIEFSDFEGKARHDFLARQGETSLEIECKTITADCGSAVHREEFELLGNDLLRRLKKLNLSGTSVRIDVALADRLPKDSGSKGEIVGAIEQMLTSPITSALVRGTSITLQRYGRSPLSDKDLQASAVRLMENIREECNGSVFGFFSKSQFIAIHLFSTRKSIVGESISDTIAEASPQFSKSKPAIVCAHFTDLADPELNLLIQSSKDGKPTLLEAVATKMFNDKKHDHIAALFFTAQAPVGRFDGQGTIIHTPYFSERGTLYPLWNKNCRLNEPFEVLAFKSPPSILSR